MLTPWRTKLGRFVKIVGKNSEVETSNYHCTEALSGQHHSSLSASHSSKALLDLYLPLNWTTTAGSTQIKNPLQTISNPRAKDRFRYTEYCIVWCQGNSHQIYKSIWATIIIIPKSVPINDWFWKYLDYQATKSYMLTASTSYFQGVCTCAPPPFVSSFLIAVLYTPLSISIILNHADLYVPRRLSHVCGPHSLDFGQIT